MTYDEKYFPSRGKKSGHGSLMKRRRTKKMLQPMINHFKTIFRHKTIVCRECIACGQIWRGIMHDNSKFGLSEFVPSAKYFQGIRSPIEAEKGETGYSLAWQHHMGHNPHHWEYWIDFDSQGHIIANKIPYPYVVEMVCDWVGAGKVYTRGKWKQSDPLDYYNKVRAGRHFHPETEALLVKFLECIKDKGLSEFHRMARRQSGYGYRSNGVQKECAEEENASW